MKNRVKGFAEVYTTGDVCPFACLTDLIIAKSHK